MDVARLAGVSPATVSFVLNQTAGQTISDETRQRVLQAVAELDYRPNRAEQGLRQGRSATIGFVSHDVDFGEFTASAIKGAHEASIRQGNLLLLVNTGGSNHQAEHLIVNTGSAGNWWSIAEFNVYYNPDLDDLLARDGWSATASDESPWPNDALVNALDGDSVSRYSSGTSQYAGMWLQVDMGEAQTFNRVELDSGPNADDYARSADVYVSTDGADWTEVASIVGDGQPTQVASFPTQTARYIKVVNTGSAGNWWSIAELNVYD